MVALLSMLVLNLVVSLWPVAGPHARLTTAD